MTKARSRKVTVHFDRDGSILAIVDAGEHEGVGAGVVPMEGARSMTVELSATQRKQSLLELHTGHRVDVRGDTPKLLALEVPGRNATKT